MSKGKKSRLKESAALAHSESEALASLRSGLAKDSPHNSRLRSPEQATAGKARLVDCEGEFGKQDSNLTIFPQYSRIFPVFGHLRSIFSRSNAPFLIIAGLLLLGIMNIVTQAQLPEPVKVLLANPYDQAALQTVLKNSTDPQMNSEIVSLLASRGEEDVAVTVQTDKNKLYETLNKMTLLLRDHTDYADGYAYRGVIYFRLHQCQQALKDIHQALELDPNRKVFVQLSQDIQRCQ